MCVPSSGTEDSESGLQPCSAPALLGAHTWISKKEGDGERAAFYFSSFCLLAGLNTENAFTGLFFFHKLYLPDL